MTFILLATIGVPLFGSLFLPFFRSWKGISAVCLLFLSALGAVFLLQPVLSGQTTVFVKNLTAWFGLNFSADALSVFMAFTAAFVGALIAVYSLGYVRKYKHQGEYYFLVTFFIGSMMGLVFSANLLLIYVFWELTAVCSWRLIGFHREEEHLLKADKAFLITFLGSVMMLVGMGLIYRDFGTLNLLELKGKGVAELPFFLLLAGMLAKSAQLPLQIWLPGAGVAPSTVTALLHAAVLVKIGVYAYARLFVLTFIPPELDAEIVAAASVLTILAAGSAAYLENDIKRILAYSTISQIGYILFGLALSDSIGLAGAVFFILAHALAKAGLFLCAGIIEQKTHTKDIRQLGGLAAAMPVTAAAFLVCSLSVIGLPPFAGFYGKLLIVMSGVQTGHYYLTGLAVFGAFITLLYLFRVFNKVFLGAPKSGGEKEGAPVMVWVVAVLGILSLILGLAPQFAMAIIQLIKI